MTLFGLEITRAPREKFQNIDAGRGGWWRLITEPFTGAWQRNCETSRESILAYFAVYSCISLIAGDVAKMRLKLQQRDDANGIWSETRNPAYSPVIRKPNRYQTRVKFFEWWVTSKLIHGNTYALKQRDNRGVVTALYILDPCKVKPLVADDGSVFYALNADTLSNLERAVVVPQREIIHDIMCALYHPLCGVSPIFACAQAALQGLAIQENSHKFFSNGAQPGGVLTAPGNVKPETAQRLKEYWEANYTGANAGRVAVLGDGLKYEPMVMKSSDAQLIEQLKFTAEVVCAVFHVPPYMIGIAPPPNFNNIEALNQQYYAQCVQTLLESLEAVLDEGLGLGDDFGNAFGVEFDLDDLLRMDSATRMLTAKEGVGGGIMTPNEGRKKFNLGPKPGGDTPYLQQQYFSLEALNKRDTAPEPTIPAPTPSPTPPSPRLRVPDVTKDGLLAAVLERMAA